MTRAPEEFPDRLPEASRRARQGGGWVLAGLIGACTAIEAVLLMADFGLVNPPWLRALAYQNGAFWAGLLRDWQPNFAAQPVTMFLTHAFLHAGPLHLLVNMVTLWSLGRAVVERIGPARFLLLYLVSALGGGLGFGLLSEAPAPMVGASGALFGLAGAWLAWEWQALRAAGRGPGPVLRALFWLALLNVALWWATGGHLAWETHLGGLIAGALAGAVLRPDDLGRDAGETYV